MFAFYFYSILSLVIKRIFYCFALLFTICFWGCEEDDFQLSEVEIDSKNENPGQIFESFSEKDYDLLFGNQKENSRSKQYKLLLDFENATSYYSEEVNTYTIPLKGGNTKNFKNLVLLEYPDATFSIVISYESDGKRTNVKSIQSAYKEDDIMVSSSNCYDTYTYSETTCTGGGNHPPGDPQCGCYDEENNCTPGYATVYVSRNCGGGDEGGGGDGDDPYPPGPTLPNPPGTIEDPLQDEYIDCVTNTLRTDCWVFCEAVNCTTGDQEKYDLANDLDLTPLEANWLFDSEFEDIIKTFKNQYNNELANASASAFVKLGYNNLLFDNYSIDNFSEANQIIDDAFDCCPFPSTLDTYASNAIGVLEEYLILKTEWELNNPNSNITNLKKAELYLKASYNYHNGTIHTVLDICGLAIDVCDPINGVLYTIEGDGLNATISFAATIPVAGILFTIGKYIKKVTYNGKVVKLVFESLDGVKYSFGSRGKLAKVMKPTANEQCHHIINWARNNHEIIQKAAQDGWHPSDPLKNGINLPKTTHCNNGCGHSAYTANLENYLDDIWSNHQDLVSTPELANEFLERVQENVKDQFADGKLLDEIIFFD